MIEYYFLFGIALLWTLFSVVQDMKTREVSNWLNFSFVGIGLAYRAFYSVINGEMRFFLLGVLGFAVMFCLAHALYYSRVFAGGDAKLLMGFGTILPYTSYWSLIYLSLGFLFVLFLMGAVWSLAYSVKIVNGNRKKFGKEFVKRMKDSKILVIITILFGVIGLFIFDYFYNIIFFVFFAVLGLLYVYLKALDKCMIVLKRAEELSEGEWLEEDVKVKGRWIRRSVHGLSWEEIRFLRKARKKILIKDGVPFTPAFLGALLVMIIAMKFNLWGLLYNLYF